MPGFTKEQKDAFQKHVTALFPGDKLQQLNSDPSLTSWWSAISSENRAEMQKIDRDQMSSASSLPTLWVKRG